MIEQLSLVHVYMYMYCGCLYSLHIQHLRCHSFWVCQEVLSSYCIQTRPFRSPMAPPYWVLYLPFSHKSCLSIISNYYYRFQNCAYCMLVMIVTLFGCCSNVHFVAWNCNDISIAVYSITIALNVKKCF